jgi:hypothetical protein
MCPVYIFWYVSCFIQHRCICAGVESFLGKDGSVGLEKIFLDVVVLFAYTINCSNPFAAASSKNIAESHVHPRAIGASCDVSRLIGLSVENSERRRRVSCDLVSQADHYVVYPRRFSHPRPLFIMRDVTL